MKRINREAIQRMVDARGGKAGGTSGGGGGSLAGYATQAWVNEGFVSIEFFNRLFTVYGPGATSSDPDVVIEPNDLDSTIKNIKAMFGLWTEQYLSALGLNPGGTGSATSLSMLDDVDITTPTNGQALVYNSTTLKWENQTISTVTALANLTDVLLTSPAANEFLMYDGTSAKWVNSAIKTINGQSLYGSGDISVGGGASGNYLPLTGGTLTNSRRDILYLNDTTGVGAYIVCNNKMSFGYNNNSKEGFIGWNNYWFHVYDAGYVKIEKKLMIEKTDYTSTQINDYPLVIRTNGYESSIEFDYGGSKKAAVGYYNSGGAFLYNAGYGGNVHLTNNGYFVIPSRLSINQGDNPSYYLDLNALNQQYVARFNNSGENECSFIISMSGTSKACIGYYSSGVFLYNFSSNNNVHLNNSGYFVTASRVSVGAGESPSYALHVSGTVYATGSVTALSDARKKDIQKDLALTVEQVAMAPAVQFLWKDRREEGAQAGSIAQYWQKVLPEVISDKSGELSMQYGVTALVSAIVTARKVQEHERRIADLECENKKLKGQLIRLNRYGE